jgi:hypothetical protein
MMLYCSDCGGERRFEQPPCPDEHGLDCPELACTVCGVAVVLGPEPVGVDVAVITRRVA